MTPSDSKARSRSRKWCSASACASTTTRRPRRSFSSSVRAPGPAREWPPARTTNMRRFACLLAAVLVLPTVGCSRDDPPQGSDKPPPGSYEVVSNTPIEAQLMARGTPVTLHGRASLYVHYEPPRAAKGQIEVRAINVRFFEVPQQALTGQAPRGKATGVLTLRLPSIGPQFVRYDPNRHTIQADKLRMEAHFAQLDELIPPRKYREYPKDEKRRASSDYTVSSTIPAEIRLDVSLGGAPPELSQRKGAGTLKAEASVPRYDRNGVHIEPFEIGNVRIAPVTSLRSPIALGAPRSATGMIRVATTTPNADPEPQSGPTMDTSSGPSETTRTVRHVCIQPMLIKNA